MAISKELLDDAEFAKKCIQDSSMSDELKRTYIRLIAMTTEATNGISQEEKIQHMTEAMFMMATLQAQHAIKIDERVETAIAYANKKQCDDCKAMKFAIAAEEKAKQAQIIEEYKRQNGIQPSAKQQAQQKSEAKTWTDIGKELILKPYVYIVIGLAIISPFGLPIIQAVLDFFSKK